FDLLRTDEVNVRVDAARRHDHAFASNDLRSRTDDEVDPRLNVGISGFADALDAAVLDADVGLHHAPVIQDERVGDDQIERLGIARLALPHAVTNHLAAAELHFFAVDGEVPLHAQEELGV